MKVGDRVLVADASLPHRSNGAPVEAELLYLPCGVERRCMDPECSCKDIAVFVGPLVVKRNRVRDGKKVKTSRIKTCRFRIDGGVILSFEYLPTATTDMETP